MKGLRSHKTDSESDAAVFTTGRKLTVNTAWSFSGQLFPVIVALAAVPLLIKTIGAQRFGILSLGWVLVGYFNVFDFGFGRALTQLVAERLGRRQCSDIPAIFWTFVWATLGLGVIAGAALALLSSWLVHDVLNLTPKLRSESLTAFYLLCVALPLAISVEGLQGFLAAHQRFDLFAAVRIPTGIAVVLGPVAVLPFSHSLAPIFLSLALVRIVTWIASLALCVYVDGSLRHPVAPRAASLRPLFSFAGWSSVSNLVAPLMAYMDRFLIGALLSATAVAYYAAPYDAITKVAIFPLAITTVLFPAFAASFVTAPTRTAHLFIKSTQVLYLILLPILATVVTFANEGMHLWLNSRFAAAGTPVLKLLCVGLLLNGLAQVPFALIQGVGRPDLTAKIHLVELPLYLALLYGLTVRRGIDGAALAWVIRVLADTTVLYAYGCRLVHVLPSQQLMLAMAVAAGVAVILALGFVPVGTYARSAGLLVVLAIAGLVGWRQVLSRERQISVLGLLSRRPRTT